MGDVIQRRGGTIKVDRNSIEVVYGCTCRYTRGGVVGKGRGWVEVRIKVRFLKEYER